MPLGGQNEGRSDGCHVRRYLMFAMDPVSSTTQASWLGANGSTMPTRKACECAIAPKLAMSPAALMIAPLIAVDASAPSARCAAHPFT